MAKELTDAQVKAAIKKNPDESIAFYAKELGVAVGSLGPTIWRMEPVARPSLQFKGNKSEIVKARKNGMRWERIAARTGLSIAEAKRVGGKEADVYTGRGARFDGSKPASGATSGRRGGRGQARATSGRRQAASNGRKTAGKPRARTRAEAAAKRAGRSPS
jgi:hypothetical protein